MMEGREEGEGQEPTQVPAVAGLETQGVGPEREDRGHTTGELQPPFQGLAYEQSHQAGQRKQASEGQGLLGLLGKPSALKICRALRMWKAKGQPLHPNPCLAFPRCVQAPHKASYVPGAP